MKQYISTIEQRGTVRFPDWTGERVYMVPFLKKNGLPDNLIHWQGTVDAMLDGVDTDNPIYLMVDQGMVKAGMPHRRPGVHIDGYWNPGVQAHGYGGGHGASSGNNRHQPIPSTRPPGHVGVPSKSDYPGNHGGRGGHMAGRNGMHTGHMSGAGSWETASFSDPEGIILASSVTAAQGFVGQFEGTIREGGDCSHIDLSGLARIQMNQGRVYAGNVSMLHETLPVTQACQRTLVRLNVPGWSPQ